MVLSVANQVEVLRRDAHDWDRAYAQQVLKGGDRLRTGRNSRALLRLSNLTDFPVGELTELEIPKEQSQNAAVRLLRGIIYFFHRDRPGEFQVDTPTVSAVVRGTEFTVAVAPDGTSQFRVWDGELSLANRFGNLRLQRGQEAIVPLDQPPARTARIDAKLTDLVQWCLYYPAVLHVDELGLSQQEAQALARSLEAYRSGDLLGALARYPADRQPASEAEQIYRAALLLAVGNVPEAESLLEPSATGPREHVSETHRTLVAALRTLIDSVQGRSGSLSNSLSAKATLATAWLAEAYRAQSQLNLEAARNAARRATEIAPGFGSAWAKVAELEFSFGRTRAALIALEERLRLAPRNAESLALKGFLLAARSRTSEALEFFNRAIDVDGALANAWLGRGLCRIHQGQVQEGRADLLVAATLEPQRAVLRSYLGKAWSETGQSGLALKELALARHLDSGDPTPWLYSALIRELDNQVNDAVRDIEESVRRNHNRQVYRSRLLLDQDQAIRGANLAAVYAEAGMNDVSLWEAGRAVSRAQSDYSPHLFLANSYNALRDLNGINLRYESAWLSEYLLANLLAPAAAGVLTPGIAQQEYTRLFERDRLGVVSSTDYASRGDWAQNAVQYGVFHDFSYTLEEDYRSQTGWRPNQDLEALTATVKFKQQFTPDDALFLQTSYARNDSGDLAQYYDPAYAQMGLRVRETQEPLLLAGWHHAWSPGSHTLVLGGYWRDRLSARDSAQPVLFVREGRLGINGVAKDDPRASADYRDIFEGYTAELQQIWETEKHALVTGARFQGGTHDVFSALGRSSLTDFTNRMFLSPGLLVTSPGLTNTTQASSERAAVYAYGTWQLLDPLSLTAGVSYDWLKYPVNFRDPPLAVEERTLNRLSPKVGLTWEVGPRTVVRAAYTESLGGVSFDQSLRLEPSQVAGLNQSFRSLAPESAAGMFSGARLQTRELSLEQRLGSNTYLGAQLSWLSESASRQLGAFALTNYFAPANITKLQNAMDYDEKSLALALNQLVGASWSLGARYRLTEAEMTTHWDIPSSVWAGAQSDVTALMHQANLFVRFAHPSGVYTTAEAIWTRQSNQGYTPALPGSDFWQANLFAGYRFPRRRAQVQLGLLNLADQDYHLNPLNLVSDLPRRRTFTASFRFAF